MKFSLAALTLSILLMTIFMLVSKTEKWSYLGSSAFECGYSSYFFSRFSFSIHYFTVGLIFLFLDLELILIMIFLSEFFSNVKALIIITIVVNVMLIGLVQEWMEKKLDWSI